MTKKQDSSRIISFRLSKEVADKLVSQGLLSEDFDRREVSNLVKEYFEKQFEGVEIKIDHTTQQEVKATVESLASIVEQQSKQITYLTDLIEGKHQPQAA